MHPRLHRLVLLLLTTVLAFSLSAACGKGRTTPDGTVLPTDSGNPLQDTTNPLPDNGNPPSDTVNPQPDNPVPPRDDPPPPPPKNERCASLYECAKTKQCGTPAPLTCLEACATETKLEGPGLSRFTTLKTCLTTNCASCQDAACLDKCILTNCNLERTKCAADDQSGADDCKTVSTCIKACQNDETCIGGCAAKASAEALTTYIQVGICDAKGTTLTPEEQKACYGTAMACDCPDKAGQGAGTCADYITCLAPCGQDTCCVAKCRSQLPQATVAIADDFTICAVEMCGTACQPNDKACNDKCVSDKCSSPYLACQCPGVGPPGMGGGKCKGGLDCIEKCSPDDVCCGATCAAAVRSSSYPKFVKFLECLPSCGCAQNDSNCFKNCSESGNCKNEAIACFLD